MDLNEVFHLGLAEDGFLKFRRNVMMTMSEYTNQCIYASEREHIEKQKDAYLKLFCGVLSQVPNFKKMIEEFGDNFESIMDLIGVVSSICTIFPF